MLSQEHDVAVDLPTIIKDFLLSHLGMVYKVNKFPFISKIEHFLRDVLSEMDHTDFPIFRRKMLICEERVFDDPILFQWLLRILKLVFFRQVGVET